MRFTSNVKPALTPLGHRLLYLSESKLVNLEPGIGGRDVGLLKGVMIREAVKSAWQSVDQGVGEFNDWHSTRAMGLDVVEEEEEEEEEKWFEDLISTFDEEVTEYQHDWVESNVAGAFDDFDIYDDEGMEAFTLTRSPPSPQPIITVAIVPEEEEIHQPAQPILPALTHPTPSSTPAGTPSPLLLSPDVDDLDDCADDFLLPPPLVRSFSSASTSSLEDDDDVCVTPPSYSCEELEEEAPIIGGFEMTRKVFNDGWLGLNLVEDGSRF